MHTKRNPVFCIISIAVIALAAAPSFAAADPNAPNLVVNAARGRHAISPDIYGINNYSADSNIFDIAPIPVQRLGGNATTRYNWLVDSSNSGFDWFYIGGSGTDPQDVAPGKSVDDMVSFDEAHQAKSIVTVPIIGLVNKFSQWNCSYWDTDYPAYGLASGLASVWPYFGDDVSDYPNHHGCGSGLDPHYDWSDAVQLEAKHPMTNHIAVNPQWMRAWIEHLVQTHGSAAAGGTTIYQMDNEPESWSYIHRDIHPAATGFDEIVNSTLAYGAMIKSVDPTAKVLGPSNWGVPAYWDMELDGDNEASHDMPWYQYYLSRMRDYEQTTGVRLLDYFDEHFYPSVDGASIANSDAGDDFTKEARLRSTRALWDPDYLQENWMGTWHPDSWGKAMIIPRLRAWASEYYPGTKIAITEYNWGGLEDINGALAEADVLGIFGREDLDLATLWGPPAADQPGAFAFRMFLNYDGAGSRYGDTWLDSTSTDQGRLAVYGAERSTDGAVTILVINKTGDDLSSGVTIRNFMPDKPFAGLYEYSAADLSQIVHKAPVSIDTLAGTRRRPVPDSRITHRFPAESLTLFVVPGHRVPGNSIFRVQESRPPVVRTDRLRN